MTASNKEGLVIILDIREDNNNFKENAIKTTSEILKEKICGDRKDLVTFLLMGTERTDNLMNTKTNDYKNIVEYPQFQNPNWNLFCSFHKFVKNERHGIVADWLDALIVALQTIKENEMITKYPHRRIILFHDFDGSTQDFSDFKTVTNVFLKEEIELIAVSSRIVYKTNNSTGTPQAIFKTLKSSSKEQLEDEHYALRMVSDCNAKLCNFEEALISSHRLSQKRPWAWQAKLMVGSEISINISGIISVKDENNIKLKKCWGAEDELPSRELRTYVKGVEMEPLDVDMINGYMLGATPIAFDESLEDMEESKLQHQPGLKVLGFPKLNSIPEEYYTGDSLYWIVHRKGMQGSAKKLDALVRALLSTQRAMLCWKIYSVKYNNPKLVVLLPNEMSPNRPASLSMIELSYHAQHHYWDFPTLCTEKTKCNQNQIDAIDELIDSMDLMLDEKVEPRQTYESDLLAFNTLPHIFEKNLMDLLERKVLTNVIEDDEQFQKILSEKNFVEIFWKVPEMNEEKAKQAAKKVQELFPLEKSAQPIKNKVDPIINTSENKETNTISNDTNIKNIGLKHPDEDFEKIIKQSVLPLKDKTIKDQQFNTHAKQMRLVIWNLIFENPSSVIDHDKIGSALHVYRSFCLDFNSFIDYNNWIEQVKVGVQQRKTLDAFWNNVIVAKNLGLCFIGKLSLEERVKLEDFYRLDFADSGINTPASEEMNI